MSKNHILSFREYMLTKHINREDPIGDLARDMAQDHIFPDGPNVCREVIEEYLDARSNGWEPVMDAFRESWQKYAAYKRRTKKTVSKPVEG